HEYSFDRLTGVFGTNVRVATLELGSESIELIEYRTPRGRPVPPDSKKQRSVVSTHRHRRIGHGGRQRPSVSIPRSTDFYCAPDPAGVESERSRDQGTLLSRSRRPPAGTHLLPARQR